MHKLHIMYVSATNRFENPGTDTWYWFKKSAKGGYVPGMLQLGKLYEETGETDEAIRCYTAIAKTEGNEVEPQVAAKRKTAIGKREPSTDINTVKPQLLKLLSSAANDYSGTLRWETEPLDGNKADVLSTSTYYSTTLETGFKNALVRKEVVQARDLGNVQIKAGTHWSYSADIVYLVSQETSLRVFEQWVTVLKTILPG